MLRWMVGVVLLFGVLLLLLPKTDQESLTKIGSASMLMCTAGFREQVAQQVMRGHAVIVRFNNTCPDLVASVDVGEAGRVTVVGNKYPVRMTLSPAIQGGQVRWSCRGEPAKAVTKLCKP